MSTERHIAIAQYRVKAGGEEKFKDVLRQHSATLRALGLITERPVEVFLGTERKLEGPFFVEIFEWAGGEEAVGLAHTHPQVTALWETIGELCEPRGGKPMFEFVGVAPLSLS
ncbi:MAG: hypothetical protein DLM59_08410 [Pseudonocardiales bacterium]|nr:MAG: hypothetical protein DLM59_08410 [Pseudonocardiales bacterium]